MATPKHLIAMIGPPLPSQSFAEIRDCLRIAAVQEPHCITIIETMIAQSTDPHILSVALASIRRHSELLGAGYRLLHALEPHEHMIRLIFSRPAKVK
jgi:hypothetical protein